MPTCCTNCHKLLQRIVVLETKLFAGLPKQTEHTADGHHGPPQHTAGESCESSESQQFIPSLYQNGYMEIKSIINSQTAEIHGACGKAFRPSLTTSPRHRPVTTTHPSQMHSTTFIHGLKCRTTHLHKNCPHLPATRHSVCLQPT